MSAVLREEAEKVFTEYLKAMLLRDPAYLVKRISILCPSFETTHFSKLNQFDFLFSLQVIHLDIVIMGSITTDNGTGAIMNEAARLKLQDAYHGAADTLETPHDVMLRLFNAVSTATFLKFS